jgi:hypothetical protein
MQRFSIYIFIILTSFGTLHAQTLKSPDKVIEATNVSFLNDFAARQAEQSRLKLDEAIRMAQDKGWPVSAQLDDQKFIQLQYVNEEGIPVYYITHNENAAISTQAARLHIQGGSGLDLEGQNMTFAVWDGGGTRLSHELFDGRVSQMDQPFFSSNHASHVAGTLAGGVSGNASAKGMAPQAQLHAYDWMSDESEMAAAAANGLLLSNHSYGTVAGWATGPAWYGDFSKSTQSSSFFGQYDIQARAWDQIAYNAPYYLIVKSAGNDRNDNPPAVGSSYFYNGGSTEYTYDPQQHPTTSPQADGGVSGYDCIASNGNAKNILTIGAVDDVLQYTGPSSVSLAAFSGCGPSDDGRIKPDLVANGVDLLSATSASDQSYASYSGTSMASPNATGSLLLLQQHYMATHDSLPMKAATLKALAIHTARACGPAPGPDYRFGWGLLSVENAANVISQDIATDSVILESALTRFDTFTYTFEASGLEPIRATIAWTDYPGNSQTGHNVRSAALVNDLDIEIRKNGQSFLPYTLDAQNPSAPAVRGVNSKDNVEMVVIDQPEAGAMYTIIVSHKSILTPSVQEFSLILSGRTLNESLCLEARNVYADEVGTTTARIQWNDPSGSDLWQVEYGPAGFQQGSGTIDSTRNRPHRISGLERDTPYEFYIRSACDSAQWSSWSGPHAFTTLCALYELPYAEEFNDSWPNCWTTTDSVVVHTTQECSGSSGYSLKVNGLVGVEVLSPVVNATTYDSIEVRYAFRKGDSDNCGNSPEDDDYLTVEFWDGAQWQLLKRHTGLNSPVTFQDQVFVLDSGLNNRFQLRIHVHEGSGWRYDNFNFDNIQITGLGARKPSGVFYSALDCATGCSFANLNHWNSAPDGSGRTPVDWSEVKHWIIQEGHEVRVGQTGVFGGPGLQLTIESGASFHIQPQVHFTFEGLVLNRGHLNLEPAAHFIVKE